MKKIYILSDIHLALNKKEDWYQKEKHESNLLTILRDIQLNQNNMETELILNGDIFDLWASQINKNTPTIKDIADSNKNVINALKNIQNKTKIFFISGNHDKDVKQSDLDNLGLKIKKINTYRDGLIKVNHGHQYSIFNSTIKGANYQNKPLGYFISRILYGKNNYYDFNSILGYSDDLLELIFTKKSFPSSVIDALLEQNNLSLNSKITIDSQKIHFLDVKKSFKNLIENYKNKNGAWNTIKSLEAEITDLDYFTRKELYKKDYKLIIHGHTHKQDFTRFSNQKVYANTGKICKKESNFIELIKDEDQLILLTCKVQDKSIIAKSHLIK